MSAATAPESEPGVGALPEIEGEEKGREMKVNRLELLKLLVPQELYDDLTELARRHNVSVEEYALSALAEDVKRIADAEKPDRSG